MITTVALDPSINTCGYAVFEDDELGDSGVIKMPIGERVTDTDKLSILASRLIGLFSDYKPNHIVIEEYQPRHDDKSQHRENLSKMIKAIGVCQAVTPDYAVVHMIKPHEWKGKKQKSRTVMECKAVYQFKGYIDENRADAIMIGHHFVKFKLHPVKNTEINFFRDATRL